MNGLIRLAFAGKQKADAERLAIEALAVYVQAVNNLREVSGHYSAMRVEVARVAERN